MKDYIKQRAIDIGLYIVKTNATCREAAEVFYVSETTVHNDMTKVLPLLDATLAAKVKHIFEVAWKEKHLRGGLARSEKCRKEKMKK